MKLGPPSTPLRPLDSTLLNPTIIHYLGFMSTVQEIEAVIPRLSGVEVEALSAWIEDDLEDQMELTSDVKEKLDKSRQEIAGANSPPANRPKSVRASLQVWSATFAKAFDALSPSVREAVQRKVDDMGARLDIFSHRRLTGSTRVQIVSRRVSGASRVRCAGRAHLPSLRWPPAGHLQANLIAGLAFGGRLISAISSGWVPRTSIVGWQK